MQRVDVSRQTIDERRFGPQHKLQRNIRYGIRRSLQGWRGRITAAALATPAGEAAITPAKRDRTGSGQQRPSRFIGQPLFRIHQRALAFALVNHPRHLRLTNHGSGHRQRLMQRDGLLAMHQTHEVDAQLRVVAHPKTR